MADRAIVTNIGRDEAAKGQMGSVNNKMDYFRIGEGGWLPTTINNESMSVAPGGTTNFTGNFVNKPIIPNSITIDEPTSAQTLTDDGSGNFTGDGYGTINYNSGEYDVTFTTAPPGGATVYGDYQHRGDPKEPDPSRADLEADNDSDLATFQKSFGVDAATKLEFKGDDFGTCICKCYVDLSEANDNGKSYPHGPVPFWTEIGLFDENDIMVAYGTIDRREKTGANTIMVKLNLIN
jgi:hypothetical protein